MLSRSSSNAGDRLRRAKSNSSAHTSSSGHQRQTTNIDPFTSRLHAEAAAVEAYERARQSHGPAQRPLPQRRRSQISGKSEGGHFEDARKRALARTSEDASKTRPVHPPQSTTTRPSTAASGEERVITRKRSVIPPSSDVRSSQADNSSSLPTTERRGRRRRSALADGSPAPRYALTVKEQESTLQIPNVGSGHADGYGGNLSHIAEFGQPEDVVSGAYRSRPSTRDSTLQDGDALAKARDRCLQDFQTKKVRERKSFIFGSFQKRRPVDAGGNFNNSLPPFNYAGNDDAAPLPQNPGPTLPVIKGDQKTRNFSDTLKGRLKKVFRKTSKAPSGLPPQHVEAPEFHFTVRDTDVSDAEDDTCLDYADPFMTIAAEDPRPPPQSKFDSNRTNSSGAETSTVKSRVTSWTNSTVAGMSTIRTNDGPFAGADESGVLKRKDSKKTLRKASSFWGRPIQNKLRRVSKTDLKGSEESQSLYDALQKRIRPSRSMEPTNETIILSQEAPSSRDSSAIATLPSQREYNMSLASRTSSTIRPVTPQDPIAYQVDIPSPVKEVLSPEPEDVDDTVITYYKHDHSENSTPRSDLKRRRAMKVPAPSQEQLARRLERSKNRWKSPLDELSPPAPRSSMTRATMDDNPYELRSLSQAGRQMIPATDLPHHARIRDGTHAVRAGALSPSVYSRATDGASPRPLTPEDLGMTTITVTGREVRRYDISPPKPTQGERHQASKEWRRWLSDEMSNFDPGKAAVELPDNSAPSRKEVPTRPPIQPRANTTSPECISRPGSVSPTMWQGPGELKFGRSRAGSAASEAMNERYPVVNASRNSSRPSIATARRNSRPGSAEPQSAVLSRPGSRKPSIETLQQPPGNTRPRAFSTESIAEHEIEDLIQSTLASHHVKETAQKNNASESMESVPLSAPSTSAVPAPTTKAVNRPKSAYELRVSYRNAASSKAKPLEVRRKAIESSILEDNTIRNISAGPYAIQRRDSPNQENSRPGTESPLPAVSSSEWLAAGTNKRKEVRKASSMHPLSRQSPLGEVRGSPGQRMVTNWLDGRKSKENSPAFV